MKEAHHDADSTDKNYFWVEDNPEGGYVAQAIGEPIFTQGETLEELRKMVQDAVQCHFDDEQRPKLIRLTYCSR